MAVNKVVRGSETLIDLTGDTVTSAEHIMAGYIGHLANGTQVTGTGQGSGATQHIIHFDFSDGTGTDIPVYYEAPFVSSAIRATNPVTYDGKTVDEAALDGIAWYTKPVTETWETIYESNSQSIRSGTPNYVFIGANTAIPLENETWRVTWQGTVYTWGTAYNAQINAYYIGNPGAVGMEDDGSGATFVLYSNAQENIIGMTTDPVGSLTIKLERLVTE